MDNWFPIRQEPNLHGTISTTGEKATTLVDLQLRHTLANVLEEAATGVLTDETVQQRVDRQTPDLKWLS